MTHPRQVGLIPPSCDTDVAGDSVRELGFAQYLRTERVFDQKYYVFRIKVRTLEFQDEILFSVLAR